MRSLEKPLLTRGRRKKLDGTRMFARSRGHDVMQPIYSIANKLATAVLCEVRLRWRDDMNKFNNNYGVQFRDFSFYVVLHGD